MIKTDHKSSPRSGRGPSDGPSLSVNRPFCSCSQWIRAGKNARCIWIITWQVDLNCFIAKYCHKHSVSCKSNKSTGFYLAFSILPGTSSFHQWSFFPWPRRSFSFTSLLTSPQTHFFLPWMKLPNTMRLQILSLNKHIWHTYVGHGT